jgi:PAS domain S-box-containing protein
MSRALSTKAAVVTDSLDAIVVTGLDGKISVWNDAASKAYGHHSTAVIGQPVDKLVPVELRTEERAIRDRVFAGDSSAHYETRRLRDDGMTVDVSCTLSPVRDERGTIVGVSSIDRDISARHQWEIEREKLLADLRRSNQDLEQFAYVASHDLSEPLRVVSGMVQLLAQRNEIGLDAVSTDYIERTVRATARMQTLINELLEYSRVGRTKLRHSVAAAEIVGDAIRALQGAVTDAGAEITVAEMPMVDADPIQLAQVFQNLLANAIKFGRTGARPQIQVSAARDDCSWRFFVKDNGIGIDKRFHARVFMIFKRLHTRDAYVGTGIGLAMCQRIVESHGGSITVESELGVGSTFSFTIPDLPK